MRLHGALRVICERCCDMPTAKFRGKFRSPVTNLIRLNVPFEPPFKVLRYEKKSQNTPHLS